jgi:hypothetical protein
LFSKGDVIGFESAEEMASALNELTVFQNGLPFHLYISCAPTHLNFARELRRQLAGKRVCFFFFFVFFFFELFKSRCCCCCCCCFSFCNDFHFLNSLLFFVPFVILNSQVGPQREHIRVFFSHVVEPSRSVDCSLTALSRSLVFLPLISEDTIKFFSTPEARSDNTLPLQTEWDSAINLQQTDGDVLIGVLPFLWGPLNQDMKKGLPSNIPCLNVDSFSHSLIVFFVFLDSSSSINSYVFQICHCFNQVLIAQMYALQLEQMC